MPSDAVADFGAFLASITDENERKRAISRAKMLGAQEAPDAAFEPPVKTLADYLATTIELPPVLVHPFMVVRGGLHATIGRAGKGKTVMNLNRLLRWSAGTPMFPGWENSDGEAYARPEEALKILVVENEGAAAMFHRQIGIMLNATGYLDDKERKLAQENILIWGDGGYSDLKLDDKNKLNLLRAGVEKWNPDIVFIEPMRSLWYGEENSATDMNVVVEALLGIANDYKCGVILAHHEKKGGGDYESEEKMDRARGSGVLEGVVTAMENFEVVKGGEARELSWSKYRHAVAPNPVRMEWDPEAWWYKWVPISSFDDAILSALRNNADEPLSITDLHEMLGESKGKLRDRCRKLTEDNRLKTVGSLSTGKGSTGVRYRLPVDENSDYGGLSV
jgi:hypothetical protein